jgi:hypothetical protein
LYIEVSKFTNTHNLSKLGKFAPFLNYSTFVIFEVKLRRTVYGFSNGLGF